MTYFFRQSPSDMEGVSNPLDNCRRRKFEPQQAALRGELASTPSGTRSFLRHRSDQEGDKRRPFPFDSTRPLFNEIKPSLHQSNQRSRQEVLAEDWANRSFMGREVSPTRKCPGCGHLSILTAPSSSAAIPEDQENLKIHS
jgi:hypothetical protein